MPDMTPAAWVLFNAHSVISYLLDIRFAFRVAADQLNPHQLFGLCGEVLTRMDDLAAPPPPDGQCPTIALPIDDVLIDVRYEAKRYIVESEYCGPDTSDTLLNYFTGLMLGLHAAISDLTLACQQAAGDVAPGGFEDLRRRLIALAEFWFTPALPPIRSGALTYLSSPALINYATRMRVRQATSLPVDCCCGQELQEVRS